MTLDAGGQLGRASRTNRARTCDRRCRLVVHGNVNERIEQMNRRQGEELLWEEYKKTEASINSYIGLHHHTDVYRRMLKLRWRKMEDVVGALCGFRAKPLF